MDHLQNLQNINVSGFIGDQFSSQDHFPPSFSCTAALPPGYRFHPTDEELIVYYLQNKTSDFRFSAPPIAEVDLNKCEPWDLPRVARDGSNEKEWYFFCVKDKKYPNGLRTNRATQAGYWKATGKDKEIFSQVSDGSRSVVGMKKTLVFYKGRAPRGEKTQWVMHEYRQLSGAVLSDHPLYFSNAIKDEWVLCRVFKKVPDQKLMPGCNSTISTRSYADDLVSASLYESPKSTTTSMDKVASEDDDYTSVSCRGLITTTNNSNEFNGLKWKGTGALISPVLGYVKEKLIDDHDTSINQLHVRSAQVDYVKETLIDDHDTSINQLHVGSSDQHADVGTQRIQGHLLADLGTWKTLLVHSTAYGYIGDHNDDGVLDSDYGVQSEGDECSNSRITAGMLPVTSASICDHDLVADSTAGWKARQWHKDYTDIAAITDAHSICSTHAAAYYGQPDEECLNHNDHDSTSCSYANDHQELHNCNIISIPPSLLVRGHPYINAHIKESPNIGCRSQLDVH